MAQGPIKARPQFTDVTSQFTVESTRVSGFKAKTDGRIVIATGTAKTGVSDQQMLFRIPTALRASTDYISGSTFCMNGTDLGKGACIASAGSEVQFRINGTIGGTSGIAFTMIWAIGY